VTPGDMHVPADQERMGMHTSASELQSIPAEEDKCICVVSHEFLWLLLVFMWLLVKIAFSVSVDFFIFLCSLCVYLHVCLYLHL